MRKAIPMDKGENQNIENLFMTYNSYMAMLQYFSETEMKSSPIYDKKWNECAQIWIKLDKAKRAAEDKYKPTGDWDSYEFDFNNCQVVFIKND